MGSNALLRRICLGMIAMVFAASVANGQTRRPVDPMYESVADEIYLQEVGAQVSTESAVTALATHGDQLFAVVGGNLRRLHRDKLLAVPDSPPAIQQLYNWQQRLWCVTQDAIYRYREGTGSFQKLFDGRVVGMCLHQQRLLAATAHQVFEFRDDEFISLEPSGGWLSSDVTLVMADGSQVLPDPVQLGPIRDLASYSGTIYLIGDRGPALLDGRVYQTEPVDWGMVPIKDVRDCLSHGSRLMMATKRGVAILRGAALSVLDGDAGLPVEDTTCLARGFEGDTWIGTTNGAIRNVEGEFHFFGADHWLPGRRVHDIVVNDREVFVATEKGLGIIRYEPFTLRDKVDYYQHVVDSLGHQRLGFVHQLYWNPTSDSWVREISDNDGGHTAHYLAALCFQFAVTGDGQVRDRAVDAWEAMLWLQSITETDGFFARSIWAVDVDAGAIGNRGSGGLPAKWNKTKDGKWLWKGDTSSDEVNAHFYAITLFHDLVANAPQKKRSVEHLSRIAKHIIDNGWVLRDVDGQPTRWGRWDPDYLLRPYGFEARGLNGMEAQTYMWAAFGLSNDPQFRAGLNQLIDWKYHTYTVREKLTFPPESVVPWDDELAFRCFHPLLSYCNDERLRSIYMRALERHWEVMRMQKVPFFNFSYGGLTGNDCEARQAVKHLREWSLDTVSHSYHNSHRADLATEPGYIPYMGGTRAISPRELACTWGSRSAIFYDGGGGGRIATPPVGWMEDYWMGRYFGMIQAPGERPPKIDRKLTIAGAKPYDGPPRPQTTQP